MNRRAYLRRTATVLGAGVIAGCTGSSTPPGGGAAGGTTETTGTTEQTRTTGAGPPLANKSFEVVESGCGTETNEASVSFDDGVVVTGTITGTDACDTATLATAGYRAGEFRVVVGTEKKGTTGACAECLTEIEYEARFAFDGGLPATVVVEHGSLGKRRRVARASASTSTSVSTSASTTTSTSS